MTEGVSRESLLSDSSLLDHKLLMSELRASADEAAWALPPSSVQYFPVRLASLPQLFTHCKVSLFHFPARYLRKYRLTSQPGAGVTAAHTHVMKKLKV